MVENHFHFVNLWQPSEERRDKYEFVTTLGYPCGQARRMRDWRWSKIFRFFDMIKQPLFGPQSAPKTSEVRNNIIASVLKPL